MPWRDLLKDTLNAISFHRKGSTDATRTPCANGSSAPSRGRSSPTSSTSTDAIVPGHRRALIPQSATLLAEAARRGHDRFVVSASPIELVGPHRDRARPRRSRRDPQRARRRGPLHGSPDGRVLLRRRQGHRDREARGRAWLRPRRERCLQRLDQRPADARARRTAVAVNPDRELRALALQRGWRIVEVGRKRH